MIPGAGKLTTKAIAVIVIVAMLDAVGLSPVIMVFVTGVFLVVWLFARRAQAREVERIFEFYIAADAILREEERRWYGFEIAEVIEHGESLLEVMPDPPPLNYYALGALYQRLGNHQATVEYLSRLIDDESYDETHRTKPSPQLRRYVMMLRRIEYHPSAAPQTLAAIRSLERARQRHATSMLVESRALLETQEKLGLQPEQRVVERKEVKPAEPEMTFAPSLPLSAISAPPPISKVLHDVYADETRAQ
jgi:tetratricopeptide (TPR) repeat protein